MEGFTVIYPFNSFFLLAFGDFNAILSAKENKGGQVAGQRCSFFGDFVDTSKVHDLGFKGSPFIWHRGSLFERLDRVLSNEAWVEFFPNCVETHVPRIKSDHRPILLSFQSNFPHLKACLDFQLGGWRV